MGCIKGMRLCDEGSVLMRRGDVVAEQQSRSLAGPPHMFTPLVSDTLGAISVVFSHRLLWDIDMLMVSCFSTVSVLGRVQFKSCRRHKKDVALFRSLKEPRYRKLLLKPRSCASSTVRSLLFCYFAPDLPPVYSPARAPHNRQLTDNVRDLGRTLLSFAA